MAKVNQNFNMYSGNTVPIYVTITDPTNTAINLTGCTLKWTLQLRGATLATKDTTNGIIITDAVNGKVRINLQPADTHQVSGSCDHELEMINTAGDVTTVMTGKINVTLSLLDV